MSRTVALDIKTYQTLVDYARKKGISIGKAASEMVAAGAASQSNAPSGTGAPDGAPPTPPRVESPIKCPSCGRPMHFDYIGLGPGRYQLIGACKNCEVRR